ncbi:hypothetical protein [Vallitalea okinawensis]|uniref:hypothetical protein n=1 Tax=Vallitalea okinawensis TaxID=2078660 RepID=UPI000CFD1957|nr:hypothetical protein [Vallitalea okinawensis]
MSIESMDKPLRIVWNVDDDGNRISIPIVDESHKVINSKITLLEIPDEFNGVTIKDGLTVLNEINPTDTEIEITSDKFRVHYGLGLIFLHTSMEGKELKISYSSRGSIMYPASRIYTDINEMDGSITNLQDIIDDVNKAQIDLDNLNATVTEGQRVEGSLITKIADVDQTVNDLDTVRDNAEVKKNEVEAATTKAETKRQELITKITEVDNSYNALDGKIAEGNALKTELDSHTTIKKGELDAYVGDDVSPAVGTKKKELNAHTTTKVGEIDSHVTTKIDQIDSHTTSKEIQLDDFSTVKETELESHRGVQEGILNIFTNGKKVELDSHRDALENSLDTYESDKEVELDSHTSFKKADLDSYVGANINPAVGTKKADLDAFTNTKKLEINTFVGDDSNPAIGTAKKDVEDFATIQKNSITSHTDSKKTEIDTYVGTDINPAVGTKKKELNNYTATKEAELDIKIAEAETSKTNLESSVSIATTKKSDLDTVIADADARHVTLQGDVGQADGKIGEIDDLKQRMSVYEDYRADVTYYPNNKVLYSGDTYLVLKEGIGITPIDDGINYKLIVKGVASNSAKDILTDIDHEFVTVNQKIRWDDTYTQNEVNNKISQVVSNLDWKEAVTTFADLATTYPSAVEGWCVSVNDEDTVYRFDGTEWKFHSGGEMPLATQVLDGKMSATDKTKLDGIENNANNYIHPATHGMDIITETTTKKVMTNSERTKLGGIEDNANYYVHPATHNATEIVTDASNRFVTDLEKSKIATVDTLASDVVTLHGDMTSHTHSYLPLSGGILTKDSSGDILRLVANPTESDISLFMGLEGDVNSYRLTYHGTGSGNNNDISIASSSNTLFRSSQDGIVNFPVGLKKGGVDVSTEGHTHLINDMNYRTIDFYVDGDADTYYPVVIDNISDYTSNGLPSKKYFELLRGYAWEAPDTWNTATHKGGLQIYMDAYAYGWGGMNYFMDFTMAQQYSKMLADVRIPEPDTDLIIFWLRGGHALYRILAYDKDITVTPYIGDFIHKAGTQYEVTHSPTTTIASAYDFVGSDFRKFSTIDYHYIGGSYRDPKDGTQIAKVSDLQNYSLTTHNHDDRFYTESEIDTFLSEKSDTSHTHSYLPLFGGTVTGLLQAERDNATTLVLRRTNSDANIAIRFIGNGTTDKYFGLGTNGELMFGATADLTGLGDKVYHTGNFNPADYLSLTGDTISGQVKIDNVGTTIGRSNINNAWLKIGDSLGIDNNEIFFNTNAYVGTIGAYDYTLDINGHEHVFNSDGDVDLVGNLNIKKLSPSMYFKNTNSEHLNKNFFLTNYQSDFLLQARNGETYDKTIFYSNWDTGETIFPQDVRVGNGTGQPELTLYGVAKDDNTATRIKFKLTDNQNGQLRWNSHDSVEAPYGLHIEKTQDNSQQANKAYLSVEGKTYSGDGFSTGNFEIQHNSTEDSLDFVYVG